MERQLTAPTSCPCGQSWSDPRVPHFCQLINSEAVSVPIKPSRSGSATVARTSSKKRVLPNVETSISKNTMPEMVPPVSPESKTDTAAAPIARRGGTSENIQVFIRIRPLIERENSQERCAGLHSIRATDLQTVEVRTSESTIKCAYDAVFDHSFSQEQVYDRVRECTQSFLQGFNSTLFAYGQTGSGKSFTMFGAETDLSRYRPGLQNSQAGIIPRAIKEIFETTVQMEADAQATVFCSFVQIYNEQIYDLLRDTQMNTPLEIHEDRKNGIFVDGLSEYAVRTVGDCLQLLQCGEQNRAVRSTHMNQVSSRSHSVFQLLLEQRRKDGTVLKSKFNLVDLAGSEKWNMGAEMQVHHISEMTNINLSLHTLGRCIASLSSKSTGASSHVPYRDSKLTRLLQDSLGGNTKTKIIATLSPSLDCVEESISTLKFADRAKKVMVMVRVNEQREIDPAYVEKLQEELEQLREVVRLLQLPTSAIEGDDEDGSNNNDTHEEGNGEASAGLKARVVRLVHENTELKYQTEKQQRELIALRQQSPQGGSSIPTVDLNILQAKQQLEITVRQLKDASDRFFRFEIEEDELKSIHSRLFHGIQSAPSIPPMSTSRSPVSAANRISNGNVMKPRPPLKLRSFGSLAYSGSLTAKPSAPMDMNYRVRGRSSSIDANNGWKNDLQATPVMTVEKELEQSRKAIEKQTKLQNWLIEKERREILKLQQEQQFIDEQRQCAAEKDARFFKRAAATKKKLLLASTLNSPSNKPATAEI
ncbi:Kinesin-related protein 5 [Phytophthora citrophthora]|uniref:Kinesin-like protein n=1 Tax=Phytophthora citrophthora TaxID=4793 RepID=A0AAD9GU53_9STRA|nr:Kinesin-related protein 5 [Phytophthora citrophthora]